MAGFIEVNAGAMAALLRRLSRQQASLACAGSMSGCFPVPPGFVDAIVYHAEPEPTPDVIVERSDPCRK